MQQDAYNKGLDHCFPNGVPQSENRGSAKKKKHTKKI
jgi:hypothetical protein